MTKTNNGTKIYNLHVNNFTALLTQLEQNPSVSHRVSLNDKDVHIPRYIVKVVPVFTYRDVHTAMKELYMTHTVHSSEYKDLHGTDIHGADISCKPFFGCLFWSGKKWKYISIFEQASGVSLQTICKQKFFKSSQKKTMIMSSVANAVKTLWMLGFAHNDLYNMNVMYDSASNTVKIIDFEMTVKLPENVVDVIRAKLAETNTEDCKPTEEYFNTLATIFANNAKDMAISLLSLSKEICHVNTDDDGFIFNTDDCFLPMMFVTM
jgi:serine/threonine protein kinase